MFITTAEFNGLSSAACRNGILHSEQKILVKIELGVICAHMVDLCRPGHIYALKIINSKNNNLMGSIYVGIADTL